MRLSSAPLPTACGPRSAALLLGLLASAAQAHHAMGGETPGTWLQGLLSGLAHPVIGWDHLLFLLGAAALTAAARLHHDAARLLLGVFVLAGVVGTLLRARGVALPAAGLALAATLLALAVGLIRVRLGASLAELLALIGGLAQGYAYGEAIVGAERSPLLAYLLGLALVQGFMLMLVHAAWQRAARSSPRRLATVQRTLAALLTVGAAWQVLA